MAHVRSTEFQHFLQVDAAIEAFRRASEAATEQMWKLALGIVLVFPVIILVAWLMSAAKIHF